MVLCTGRLSGDIGSGFASGTATAACAARVNRAAGATIVDDYHAHGDYSLMDSKAGAAIRTSDPARDAFTPDHFSGDSIYADIRELLMIQVEIPSIEAIWVHQVVHSEHRIL